MSLVHTAVAASNQDCLVYANVWGDWEMKLAHQEVSIGFHGITRYAQGAGLYFPNLGVPPRADISSAHLIFTPSKNRKSPFVFGHIDIEENASPIPFSDLADYWARNRYSKSVSCHFKDEPWRPEQERTSPNIGSLIQRVVNLPGWASGNPIVLFWNDHPGATGFIGGAEKVAYSYDDNPAKAPRLKVFYSEPKPLPSPVPTLFAACGVSWNRLHDGYLITVVTDTPVKLLKRWTTVKPQIHIIPTLRRGLLMHGNPYFCFVTYEEEEQVEPTETLVHTFIQTKWPSCQTRWFYFVGVNLTPNPAYSWPFWEPWGATLTQFNPWKYLNTPPQVEVAFDRGTIVLTNKGNVDCGVTFDPLVSYPIENLAGKPLYLVMNNLDAAVFASSSGIGLAGYFHHPGEGLLYFTLWLAYGGLIGAVCPFGTEPAPPWDRGWKCIGLDTHEVDMLQLWKDIRIGLGKGADPADWTLINIHFGMTTQSPTSVDWLKNDYIGLCYPTIIGGVPDPPIFVTTPSKSTSAVFELHFIEGEMQLLIDEPWTS